MNLRVLRALPSRVYTRSTFPLAVVGWLLLRSDVVTENSDPRTGIGDTGYTLEAAIFIDIKANVHGKSALAER